MPRASQLAVAGLVATGLFIAAISVPPLFNPIFGEEPRIWSPGLLLTGLTYLVIAALFGALRNRVGVALAMISGLLSFTMALGFTLSRIEMLSIFRGGTVVDSILVELIVFGLLAGVQAVVVIGVLDGARRWNLLAELNTGRFAAAALLAGIGLALGLGPSGGDYAITLTPITMPQEFRAVQYTIAIPHFVAFAAIVLNGRFATIGSLAVTVASMLLAVRVLAGLFDFRGGVDHIVGSVVLWALLLIAEVAVVFLLLASAWLGSQGTATKPPASAAESLRSRTSGP